MDKTLFIIYFLAVFISCKSPTSKDANSSSDTSRQTQHFLDTTTFQPNTIDTFTYSNLPYWDSSISQSGEKGYKDTFSLNNKMFRLIHNDTSYEGIIEKYTENKWMVCFAIELGNYSSYYLDDVNDDGYPDFLNSGKWGSAVYLFDSTKNNFIDTICCGIPFEWTLIDTTRKIFCDFADGKQMCHQIHSTLYTFKGFKKYDLYDLELYNCTDINDNTDTITKLILNKCIKGQDSSIEVNQTILLHPIVVAYDSTYFDYKKYWQDKYKTLLNYR